MTTHDPQSLRRAYEMFGDYLSSEKTSEEQWQQLFSEFPLILSEHLPVKISSLYPQVALESGRPDFLFFEQPGGYEDLGYYGLIELKRPRDSILRIYSSMHLARSAALAQAQDQVEHYMEDLRRSVHISGQHALLLSHSRYVFIIMGHSAEIIRKCRSQVHQRQFRNLLPPGFEVVPYDVLFRRLSRTITSAVIVEVMPASSTNGAIKEPKQYRLVMDDHWGDEDRYRTCLLTNRGMFPLFGVKMRQIFGVPRKIWPLPGGRLVDNYFYECQEKLGPESYRELLREIQGKNLPWDATEIDGEFDSNEAKWKHGSKMKVCMRHQGIEVIELADWSFNFYEGDKLYLGDGRAYFISQDPTADEP